MTAWQRHPFRTGTFQERWYEAQERFFLARCDDPSAVTLDSWTELELQTIKGCRWWTLDEMVTQADNTVVFVPRELPRLFPDVLAGRLPAEPYAVDVDGHA